MQIDIFQDPAFGHKARLALMDGETAGFLAHSDYTIILNSMAYPGD